MAFVRTHIVCVRFFSPFVTRHNVPRLIISYSLVARTGRAPLAPLVARTGRPPLAPPFASDCHFDTFRLRGATLAYIASVTDKATEREINNERTF